MIISIWQVVANPIFRNTPIFLFLNKKDIFESMISKTPLTVCYPDFAGPKNDVHAALEYLQAAYSAIMEEAVPGKTLHTHVVAARVRMDMKVAWGDVKDQVRSRTVSRGVFWLPGAGETGGLLGKRGVSLASCQLSRPLNVLNFAARFGLAEEKRVAKIFRLGLV